jgi:hypothetical protein
VRSFDGTTAHPVLNAPSQAEKFGYGEAFFGGVFVAGIPAAHQATPQLTRVSQPGVPSERVGIESIDMGSSAVLVSPNEPTDATNDDALRLAVLTELDPHVSRGGLGAGLGVLPASLNPRQNARGGLDTEPHSDWLDWTNDDLAILDVNRLVNQTNEADIPPGTARRTAAAGSELSNQLHTLVHQLGSVLGEDQPLAWP